MTASIIGSESAGNSLKPRPSSVLAGSNWNSLAVRKRAFSSGPGLSVMKTWQEELFVAGALSSL